MGAGRLDPKDWEDYSSRHVAGRTSVTGSSGLFSSTSMVDDLDPKGKVRESCDSDSNPNSTPIIIGLDDTGSMGNLFKAILTKGLPTMAKEIYDRKPVTDPHLMFMGIGDAFTDRNPLQVTQFEGDIRIAEQLQKIHFESGGGSNDSEGYILAWYFAAYHTKIDSFTKRKKKGLLFTIGDDGPTPYITTKQAEKIFGDSISADITAQELFNTVSRQYEVYHLCLEDGHSSSRDVTSRWQKLIGERAISVADHTMIGEIIVSLLQLKAGHDRDDIIKSWDHTTSLVVKQALNGITAVEPDSDTGLVEYS